MTLLLAEQIVLGLPHIKTHEDAAALWGVLERNGGLDQGNLKFRLADVICIEKKGSHIQKTLLPFLHEMGALEDQEFLMGLLKVSLSRGTDSITKKLLEYPHVRSEVLGIRAGEYLAMPLKSRAVNVRRETTKLLLATLDFTQTAKNDALSVLIQSAVDESGHERLHEVFACLIDAGANPTVSSGSLPGNVSVASFMATRASSFAPCGADFLGALIKSPHWKSVLGDDGNGKFAWNWFNAGGDMKMLLDGLEKVSSSWWEGDSFNVLAAALLEEQTKQSPLFGAIKSGVKKKAPQNTITMSSAVSIAEDAIRLACESCADPQDCSQFSLLDQIFESLRPSREITVDELSKFWGVRAPMIAPLFEEPNAWRLLCSRVHGLINTSTKGFTEDQVTAFIAGLHLEFSTNHTERMPSRPPRRI